jgi:pimeloyl-ACP methyl ester carboxylesterase
MARKLLKIASLLAVLALALGYLALWRVAQAPVGPGDADWEFAIQAKGWSRILTVDGAPVHYLDAGRGPVILMLHGFGDSSYTWHENLDALAGAGFRVVAVDLPGHGRSGLPADLRLSPQALADWTARFLDRLGVEKAVVAGSSLGGNVALALAADHPDRVDRLILLGPLGYMADRYWLYHYLASSTIVRGLFQPLFGPWVIDVALRGCYWDSDKVTPRMVAQKAKPLARPEYVETLARVGSEYLGDDLDALSLRYPKIKAPALIVWGEADRAIPPDRFASRLHRDLEGSRLVLLPQTGHLPHQEAADIVNKELTKFCR